MFVGVLWGWLKILMVLVNILAVLWGNDASLIVKTNELMS